MRPSGKHVIPQNLNDSNSNFSDSKRQKVGGNQYSGVLYSVPPPVAQLAPTMPPTSGNYNPHQQTAALFGNNNQKTGLGKPFVRSQVPKQGVQYSTGGNAVQPTVGVNISPFPNSLQSPVNAGVQPSLPPSYPLNFPSGPSRIPVTHQRPGFGTMSGRSDLLAQPNQILSNQAHPFSVGQNAQTSKVPVNPSAQKFDSNRTQNPVPSKNMGSVLSNEHPHGKPEISIPNQGEKQQDLEDEELWLAMDQMIPPADFRGKETHTLRQAQPQENRPSNTIKADASSFPKSTIPPNIGLPNQTAFLPKPPTVSNNLATSSFPPSASNINRGLVAPKSSVPAAPQFKAPAPFDQKSNLEKLDFDLSAKQVDTAVKPSQLPSTAPDTQDVQKEIASMASELDKVRNELTSVRAGKEAFLNNIQQQANEITLLNEKIKEQSDTIASMNSQIKQMQQQMRSKEEALFRSQQQFDQSMDQVNQLRGQTAAKDLLIKQQQEQIVSLQEKVFNLEKNAKQVEQASKLQQDLIKAREESARSKQELSKLKEELSATNSNFQQQQKFHSDSMKLLEEKLKAVSEENKKLKEKKPQIDQESSLVHMKGKEPIYSKDVGKSITLRSQHDMWEVFSQQFYSPSGSPSLGSSIVPALVDGATINRSDSLWSLSQVHEEANLILRNLFNNSGEALFNLLKCAFGFGALKLGSEEGSISGSSLKVQPNVELPILAQKLLQTISSLIFRESSAGEIVDVLCEFVYHPNCQDSPLVGSALELIFALLSCSQRMRDDFLNEDSNDKVRMVEPTEPQNQIRNLNFLEHAHFGNPRILTCPFKSDLESLSQSLRTPLPLGRSDVSKGNKTSPRFHLFQYLFSNFPHFVSKNKYLQQTLRIFVLVTWNASVSSLLRFQGLFTGDALITLLKTSQDKIYEAELTCDLLAHLFRSPVLFEEGLKKPSELSSIFDKLTRLLNCKVESLRGRALQVISFVVGSYFNLQPFLLHSGQLVRNVILLLHHHLENVDHINEVSSRSVDLVRQTMQILSTLLGHSSDLSSHALDKNVILSVISKLNKLKDANDRSDVSEMAQLLKTHLESNEDT